MKRILIRLAALTFMIAGLVAVLWPVDDWRLYDANWQPLAMTEAEAYCAGFVFAETQVNQEDPIAAANCIAENEGLDNETHTIVGIVLAGCKGFEAITTYPADQCAADFESFDLWWLANGGFTREWNSSNSRPEVVENNFANAPRREGRDDDPRNDTGRGFGE